jgi:predicted chitinase
MTRVAEDMIYTTTAYLLSRYPSAFPTATAAAPFVRNPDALAEKVYGSLGGHDLRGRGLAQLTGTANYTAYAKAIGKPISDLAPYLLTPEGAADSAAWFYAQRGCLALADKGDLLGVTKLWEGTRAIGWTHVQQWHKQILAALGGTPAAASRASAPAAPVIAKSPPPITSGQQTADALMDQFNPPEGE